MRIRALLLTFALVAVQATAENTGDCDASQADMNRCAEQDFRNGQKPEIAAFAELRAATRGKNARRRLDREEAAWAKRQFADCADILNPEVTYSNVHVDYWECLREATENRTSFLKRRLDCIRGDTIECGILQKMKEMGAPEH